MGKKSVTVMVLVALFLALALGCQGRAAAGNETPFTVDTIRIRDFYRDARFARIVDTELHMVCYLAEGQTIVLECFKQGEE